MIVIPNLWGVVFRWGEYYLVRKIFDLCNISRFSILGPTLSALFIHRVNHFGKIIRHFYVMVVVQPLATIAHFISNCHYAR